MVDAVRLCARRTHPHLANDRVGSHTLRTSGATALKLHGVSDSIIMKLGRWRSNTFLRYIQSQFGHLTRGIAAAMSTPLTFHNVAALPLPSTAAAPLTLPGVALQG
jgi:hypothetical protein